MVAALLHDVGHLLDLRDGADAGADGDLRHEAAGARFLGSLFGADVTEPVALHVTAKRYRVAVDPAYAAQLSPGSVESLRRQGGPLDAAQVTAFESARRFRDAVRLREWDDRGKVDGLATCALEHYVPLLERLSTWR